MKRKVVMFVSGILLMGFLTGCGTAKDDNQNEAIKKTKGKCSVLECIKQIKPENTVEEINKIIGFDGELTDEQYGQYYWKLSDETGIEVSYYSGDKGTIVADVDREYLKNNKVDLSRYDELKTKVNSGITYDDFITYVGNVDGIITEKSAYIIKYTWVASNDDYLNASFSTSTNKCSFVTGMIK